MSPPWLGRLLAAIALGFLSQLLLLGAFHFLTSSWWDHRLFLAVFAASFLLYLLAAWLLIRSGVPGGWAVLAAVVVATPGLLTLALRPPVTSGDIYRYVWDGRVMAHHINPYQYAPAAPELAPLRDDRIYPQVGLPELQTVYPPLAQGFFRLAYALTPDQLTALKLGQVACALLTIFLLIPLLRAAGRPLTWLALYAWHPLLGVELAQAGHVDGLALPLVVLALLAAARRRPAWAGALVGAATLVKLYPIVLLPALWRRWDWRLPAACVAVVAAGYLAFAGPGAVLLTSGTVLGSLRTVADAHFNVGPIWSALGAIVPFARARLLPLAALAAVAVWQAARPPGEAEPLVQALARRAAVMAGGYLLVTTVVNPWYVTFALPLLALWPASWLVALSGLLMLSYLNYAQTPWGLRPAVRLAEYLPVYLLVLYAWWQAVRRRGASSTVDNDTHEGRPA